MSDEERQIWDLTDEEYENYKLHIAAEDRRRYPPDHACYSCGTKVSGSLLVDGYSCRKCGNTTFLPLREAE